MLLCLGECTVALSLPALLVRWQLRLPTMRTYLLYFQVHACYGLLAVHELQQTGKMTAADAVGR